MPLAPSVIIHRTKNLRVCCATKRFQLATSVHVERRTVTRAGKTFAFSPYGSASILTTTFSTIQTQENEHHQLFHSRVSSAKRGMHEDMCVLSPDWTFDGCRSAFNTSPRYNYSRKSSSGQRMSASIVLIGRRLTPRTAAAFSDVTYYCLIASEKRFTNDYIKFLL